jgi:hypothetical protein
LDLINYIFKTKDGVEVLEPTIIINISILISFGNNEKENPCCDCNSLIKKQKSTSSITVMHLSLSDEVFTFNLDDKKK